MKKIESTRQQNFNYQPINLSSLIYIFVLYNFFFFFNFKFTHRVEKLNNRQHSCFTNECSRSNFVCSLLIIRFKLKKLFLPFLLLYFFSLSFHVRHFSVTIECILYLFSKYPVNTLMLKHKRYIFLLNST